MKVLFATSNPAKVERYAEQLKKNNIELITLKDLNFKVEIEEKREKCFRKCFNKSSNIL